MPGMFRALSCVLLSSVLAGCAGTPPRPELPDGETCMALFAQVDRRIEKAGVADAGYARVPGFPYLRSDRFSASFAGDVGDDMDTFWEWVGYLRANEDEARDIELRNLNIGVEAASSTLIDLRGCGAWLRSWELDDASFRAHLLSVVQPPDEYSTVARTLGLYPLARPLLDRAERQRRQAVAEHYRTPLESLPVAGELALWSAQISEEYLFESIDLRRKPRDRLGRIGMLESEIRQLAQYHAPQLWIDTAAPYDLPGAPVVGRASPGVDVQQPVVYYLPGYTRFGGRNLLQMNYFVWFDRHVSGNGAEGPLDGLIWRVTFDERGEPLIHDTIRADGSDHRAYLVRPLPRRGEDDERAAPLFPQADVPAGRVALRLASGTHDVQRVMPVGPAPASMRREYVLRPYDDLLLLPLPEGGTRSLFDDEGFVAGTERSARLWRWPSGVRNAGAIRQWGRHATSLTEPAHFDDPFLFERVLVAPPRGEAPVADSRRAD